MTDEKPGMFTTWGALLEYAFIVCGLWLLVGAVALAVVLILRWVGGLV